MDLAQLNMFKTVAEQGSIIAASRLLHCVPSNITQRLKLLEEDVGVSLFLRTGRGLVITPAGDVLLGYAHQILSTCQAAKHALTPNAEPSGLLKIGAIESAAIGRLPAVLSGFHQRYPSVELQFSTAPWQELAASVAALKLDAAIVATPCGHNAITHHPLHEEPVVVIAAPSQGPVITANDLDGKRIYLWPQPCPYRQSLTQWLSRFNVCANLTDIASYGTILGCVRAGAGISLVPAGLFESFKKAGDITGYHVEGIASVRHYLIVNKQVGVHPALRAFSSLLHDTLGVD